MADLNLRQTVSPKVTQRTVLLGRVKMAQAIQMRESEWARMLSEVEKDPLFQELLAARPENQRVITYKRHSRTTLSGQFYEVQDINVVGGQGGESPETLLNKKKHLLKLIEKIGQPNFEKYFLYREEGIPLEKIAVDCAIALPQAQELQDFILNMSVQAEFYHPSGLDKESTMRPTMVGKIIRNDDGTFSISFFSPHLARGRYEINRDALKHWKKTKKLDRIESARLRKFVGLLELSNLKQGAFLRVVEYLLNAQQEYLDSGDMTKMAPVSLRQVSRILQFAPSTISRVMSTKSVLLPWDHEVMLVHLMPGRRKVVLEILEKMISEEKKHHPDIYFSELMANKYGIKISRRTMTACRHALNKAQKENPS
jgi:Sigma-54, DNA binding domain